LFDFIYFPGLTKKKQDLPRRICPAGARPAGSAPQVPAPPIRKGQNG